MNCGRNPIIFVPCVVQTSCICLSTAGELGALDIRYPASRIGFCSEGGSPVYSGTLYYHVGQRRD